MGGCGVTDEVASWMDDIQHGAQEQQEDYNNDNNKIDIGDSAHRDHDHRSSSSSSSSWFKYSHEANDARPMQNRTKRSTTSKSSGTSRTTCSLFIQTDPLLWRHFFEAEKHNADNTRKEITSLIAQHVKAVNAIYMETKFDGKYPHRMTRFEVQRIKIDDYEACEPNYNGEENKFCLPNIDVSNFLNLHSQGNHEDFCLAYVFTYR